MAPRRSITACPDTRRRRWSRPPRWRPSSAFGRLFVKDESARFDLRAFKYLGASWGGFLAVAARTGYAGPALLDGLRSYLASVGVAADGS